MKVFGKMIKNMVLEFIDFQTRINMRACGRMILDMEMEPMILVQETHTAENGVLTKYMAKVSFNLIKKNSMRVTSKEAQKMAKENMYFKTVIFMKEVGKMAKNMAQDITNGLMKKTITKHIVIRASFNMIISTVKQSFVTHKEIFTCLDLKMDF